MPKRLIIFLVFIILLVLANAGFYKWIDEEGKTHYSDSPPAGSSQVIEPESGPSDEKIQRAREDMKSSLERQRQSAEAKRVEREQKQKEIITSEQEDDSRIQQCIFAQDQLKKLKLQRPVYRVLGKGDDVYVEYLGNRIIFGQNNELIINDWVEGERIYIEDSQRSVEIVRYQNEVESYCGSGSGGLEKQNAARSKLEKDWICVRARKHLEKLSNPDMHIPSSDIRKAESWMKSFCNE